MSALPKASAPPSRLRAGAYGSLLLVLFGACSPAETGPSSPAQPADVTQDAGCIPSRLLADGACCPVGHFADDQAGHCLAVGPPECAQNLVADPLACVPRWCSRHLDADGASCDPNAAGCELTGERCTADELAAGSGCPAGSFPSASGQDCLLAGLPSQGQVVDGDLLPPLQASAGVPELAPLPPPEQTRFCGGGATPTRLCGADEAGCGPGKMPDPDAAESCIPVGAPWLCPPGFVGDPAATPAPGGGTLCKPDPADCGDDPFAGITDGPGHVFVEALAAAGGDGTRAKPLKTLAAAIKAAGAGGTVVLAAGTYPAGLQISQPLRVIGRCAALVRIVAPPTEASFTLMGMSAAGEFFLRGVSLEGGRGVSVTGFLPLRLERSFAGPLGQGGVLVDGLGSRAQVKESVFSGIGTTKLGYGIRGREGGQVTLVDVCLSDIHGIALLAHLVGGRVDGTRVRIDGVQPFGVMFGYGVDVGQGGTMTLRSSHIRAASVAGVTTTGVGSLLKLTATLVEGTRLNMGKPGETAGIAAVDGGRIELSGVRLHANRIYGATVTGVGGELLADGLIVDDTLDSLGTTKVIAGLYTAFEGVSKLRSARFSHNVMSGIRVQKQGHLEASDLLIDDSTAGPELAYGQGLLISAGGTATLQRARVHGNRSAGVDVRHQGSSLYASELLVDGTMAREMDYGYGFGVELGAGGRLVLERSRLSGNLAGGMYLTDEGADAVVRGSLIDAGGATTLGYGLGIFVLSHARLTVIGCRLQSNRLIALLAEGAAGQVRVVGTSISGTESFKLSQVARNGQGIVLRQTSERMYLVASRLVRNRMAGVFVANAALTVDGCVIADTMPATGQEVGRDLEFSDGMVANGAIDLEISHSLVAEHPRAGLLLNDSINVKLRYTAVTRGLFGLVSQGSSAVDALGLVLMDNQQNHAGDAGLTVPEAPSLVDP